MKQQLLSDGAIVFDEGDPSRSLCFIVSGSLEIQSGGKTLDTAFAGECLGELTLLTGERRNETVVFLGESEVLELSFSAMDEVARNHPRVKTVLDRMYHGRVLQRVLAQNLTTTADSELLRIDRDELAAEYPKLKETLQRFHLERVSEAVARAKRRRMSKGISTRRREGGAFLYSLRRWNTRPASVSVSGSPLVSRPNCTNTSPRQTLSQCTRKTS